MVFFVAPQSAGPDEPPAALMMVQFIFPIFVSMVMGEVTVRGKPTLYLYRKVPSGEGQLMKALLLKGWFMTVPMIGGVTAPVTFFRLETTALSLVVITVLMMLFVAGYVVFVLGLFLLNPPFSEKSVKVGMNIIGAMLVSVVLFAISLVILTEGGRLSEPVGGLMYLQVVETVMCWIVGTVSLYLGKERLRRIE